ncbi:MAG TPA: hypothetical protein VIM71_06410 [Lacunisphaera sp.]
MPIGKLLGNLASGATDFFTAGAQADAQRKGLRNARSDLNAGYSEAQGFQRPIYDTGVKNYTNLSDAYGRGEFDPGRQTPFQFDPQSVFQDPEYQASMRAGTSAINSGAAGRGMLYSGNTLADLSRFGQDTFARRSDALYDRGFTAHNTAFNQNLQRGNMLFGQGMDLARPGFAAAGNLSNLATSRGSDLANINMGMANVRAGELGRKASAAGGLFGDLGEGWDQYLGRAKTLSSLNGSENWIGNAHKRAMGVL